MLLLYSNNNSLFLLRLLVQNTGITIFVFERIFTNTESGDIFRHYSI